MTELCCWISRNWACWICCACCICWACKSSSCFFNLSYSWRNEISLSCFSEKYEIKSLDVDLRDLFCEPSPVSFSFLFLVSPNVSSETFRIFFACTSSCSIMNSWIHQFMDHLFQCDWVLSQMLYALLSISTYIFLLTDCIGHELILKWLKKRLFY